jgi:hypothetical protein
MAELKRKDDELTTADLVGRNKTEAESRPQLVRNEQRTQAEDESLRQDEILSDRAGNERPFSNETGIPTATVNRPQAVAGNVSNQPTPLFSESEVGDFRSRWGNIQTAFVDEPRRAVEDADNLVASLMKKLAEGFANERSRLEQQWDRGENISTEDLRIALQRYRSFFDRLLKV